MKSLLGLALGCITQVSFAGTNGQSRSISGRVELYYNEITNNKLTGRLVCAGNIQFPVQDARNISQQNGMPSVAFKDCAIGLGGQTISSSAWLGAGILSSTGHQNQPENQRTTQLAISVGDQNTGVWFSEYDLAQKDKRITMDIPIPPQLRNSASSSQWMRIIADFNEQ